jgi:hypothetical protein
MQLRARPDPLDNAINFEVSSAAWLEPRREVAANRPIWAQFVSTDVLAEGRRRTFVETLAEQLREGVRHAGYLLDRLMDVQKSREATLASLRERKLLRE